MANRMNRYSYEDKSRTKKNEDLYKNVYTSSDYNDLSNVTVVTGASEIDVEKIKELIRGNERLRRQPKEDTYCEEVQEEKNYDIKDILEEAKKTRSSSEKEEFLKDKHYDYLLNSKLSKNNLDNMKKAETSVKEILDSISKTMQLNNISNEDLSLELLNDLKTNTAVIDNTPIRKLIEEERKLEKEMEQTNLEMDKSFYTSNILFDDKEFNKKASNRKETFNLVLKIFLILVVVVILILTILLVIKNF